MLTFISCGHGTIAEIICAIAASILGTSSSRHMLSMSCNPSTPVVDHTMKRVHFLSVWDTNIASARDLVQREVLKPKRSIMFQRTL
jgi:hypothetical protein